MDKLNHLSGNLITIYCKSEKINANFIYRHPVTVEEQLLCKTILVQETPKQKCKSGDY